jgi:hypothetical protein
LNRSETAYTPGDVAVARFGHRLIALPARGRLAELAGTGKLDPDDNDDLQRYLLNVCEDLTGGLTSVVIEVVDDGYLEDNYSDGSTVCVKNQIAEFPLELR